MTSTDAVEMESGIEMPSADVSGLESDFGMIEAATDEVEASPEFDLDAEIGSLDSLLDEAVAEETIISDSTESSEESDTFNLDLADNGIDFEMSPNNSLDLDLDVGSKGVDNILPTDSAYKSVESKDDSLLSDFDDSLSFLDLDADESVEETQIETKIDLAKAYIDMGDIEGARSTLEEVMLDGSEEQKLEAEELLHHTG